MAAQHPFPEGEHTMRHNLHPRAPYGIRLKPELLKLHPYLGSSPSLTCFLYFIVVSPKSPFLINCLHQLLSQGVDQPQPVVFSEILGPAPRMGLNHHCQVSLFFPLDDNRDLKTIAPKQSVPRWWCLFCKAICKCIQEWWIIGAPPMNLFRDLVALYHYFDVFRSSLCVHRGLGNWLFACQSARRLWIKFCPLRLKGWPEPPSRFGSAPAPCSMQGSAAASRLPLSAPTWSEKAGSDTGAWQDFR